MLSFFWTINCISNLQLLLFSTPCKLDMLESFKSYGQIKATSTLTSSKLKPVLCFKNAGFNIRSARFTTFIATCSALVILLGYLIRSTVLLTEMSNNKLYDFNEWFNENIYTNQWVSVLNAVFCICYYYICYHLQAPGNKYLSDLTLFFFNFI